MLFALSGDIKLMLARSCVCILFSTRFLCFCALLGHTQKTYWLFVFERRGIKSAIGTSAIVPILALYSGNSGADSGKLEF
jgi:hypothetical protein